MSAFSGDRLGKCSVLNRFSGTKGFDQPAGYLLCTTPESINRSLYVCVLKIYLKLTPVPRVTSYSNPALNATILWLKENGIYLHVSPKYFTCIIGQLVLFINSPLQTCDSLRSRGVGASMSIACCLFAMSREVCYLYWISNVNYTERAMCARSRLRCGVQRPKASTHTDHNKQSSHALSDVLEKRRAPVQTQFRFKMNCWALPKDVLYGFVR